MAAAVAGDASKKFLCLGGISPSLHRRQAGAPSQDQGFRDRTAAVSHKTGTWAAAHSGGGDTEAQPDPFSSCVLIRLSWPCAIVS